MGKNIQEFHPDLYINKEISEMFSNKYFLTKLVGFLNIELNYLKSLDDKQYGSDIDTINSFLNTIIEKEEGSNKKILKKEVDVIDIYIFVFDYFSYGNMKTSFIEYIAQDPKFNIDKIQKEFTKFLKIGDYLLSRLNNSSIFNDNEILEALLENLKVKISSILLEDFNNAIFELRANGFSSVTENGYEINKVDFDNSFSFGDEKFVYIEYLDNKDILNKSYINKNGKIYRNRKGDIVISIDYVFNFGGYNFTKTVDSYGNKIVDTVGLDGNKEPKIFQVDDVFIGNLSINNINLEYLIAKYKSINKEYKVENESQILNEKMEEIKISDLIYFINHLKLPIDDEHLKGNDYLSRFDEIYKISEINGAKEFDEINFIELTVYDGQEKNQIVTNSMGKILSDDEGFIGNINNIDEILDKKFLSYGKYHGTMEGYLDRDMNVIEIEIITNGKKKKYNLFNLEKIFPHNEKQYYKINNNPELIISEEDLKNQLSKYNSFKGIINNYSVDIYDGDIEIEGKKYDRIKISHMYNDTFIFDFFTKDNKETIKIIGIDNLFKKLKGNKNFIQNIVSQLEYLTK